jgi:transposase-like protein
MHCGQIYEARDGTTYAEIRTDLQTYRLGAKLLVEGNSLRATGRILTMDKDTISEWVARLGEHCAQLAAYHFRKLHLSECQWDELWTFVFKKKAHLTPLEQMLPLSGDTWIWVAFAPMSKLVPAWLASKRTLNDGKKFIQGLKNRLDAHIPFFTSDDLPH